jgi:hypothetical protein
MTKATSWTQVSLEAKVLRYKPDSYELFANWLESLGFPMTLEQVKTEVNRIRQDGNLIFQHSQVVSM